MVLAMSPQSQSIVGCFHVIDTLGDAEIPADVLHPTALKESPSESLRTTRVGVAR